MKFTPLDPPRTFETGRGEVIRIADCGRLELAPNEQVTLVTSSCAEWDVARKDWGFYATPSLNGRLLNFGLRAALVKNCVGKYYVFLIERGCEAEVDRYLASEQNILVRWLDNEVDLAAIETPGALVGAPPADVHCMCGADRLTTAHTYFTAPGGEVAFPHAPDAPYRREIFRCELCGHFLSVHHMDTEAFYTSTYVDATYGDATGLRANFSRIVSLPPDRSDNAGRVARVREYAQRRLGTPTEGRSVLDVGSGLCVFLHGMKQAGWNGTALDPDPRAAAHARDAVGVRAIVGDFMTVPPSERFDLISFNKVLEHVKDPVAMLRRAGPWLADGGLVYIELPDGEAASAEGFGREEFFIEHYHVFSASSIALLAARAGFRMLQVERLREPSTKFTLCGFLERGPHPGTINEADIP